MRGQTPFTLNMNANKNGWPSLPQRKQYSNDWQHSDFASPGVGATYVKKMYKKSVIQVGLNEGK